MPAPPGKIKRELEELEKTGKIFLAACTLEDASGQWRNIYGNTSPQQLYDFFKPALKEIAIGIHITPNARHEHLGYSYATIEINSPMLEQRDGHGVMFLFDKNKRKGTLDTIYLRPEFQCQGLTRPLILRCVEWCQHLRLDDIATDAEEMGGYVWAKMGFRPGPISWPLLKPQLLERLKSYENFIPAGDRPRYQHVIDLLWEQTDPANDSKKIWDIADLDILVPTPEELKPHVKSEEEKRHTKLGKAILAYQYLNAPRWEKTCWGGPLFLKDKEAMDRFYSYMGKEEKHALEVS